MGLNDEDISKENKRIDNSLNMSPGKWLSLFLLGRGDKKRPLSNNVKAANIDVLFRSLIEVGLQCRHVLVMGYWGCAAG